MKKRRYRYSKKEEEEDIPRYPISQMENPGEIDELNDFPGTILYVTDSILLKEDNQVNGLLST